MNVDDALDRLDALERDIDLALDTERDRVGFIHQPAAVAGWTEGSAGSDSDPATFVGQGFCPSCGYRWDLHDNRNVLNKSPFGCPTETVARLEWGR